MWQTDNVDMLGLPPPPTDDYHKFRALAGIWLVFGTVVSTSVGLYHFTDMTYETRARAVSLRADVDALDRSLELANSQLALDAAALHKLAELTASLEHSAKNSDALVRDLERDAQRRFSTSDIEALKRAIGATHTRAEALRGVLTATRNVSESGTSRVEALAAKTTALHKDLATANVLTEKVIAFGVGLIVIIVAGALLCAWGVRLARDGLEKWSMLQELQDEQMRRQLAATPIVSSGGSNEG
ncbi:MAG TPA: hypothetical protein VNI54_12160 [Thermoanaerobaculia bacterium]|nr:hypothetical protein [Thermoanaerobaculia bacterium]